ncbi:MAG: cadherin domain-containing protein [Ekhidna sp.]
MSNKYLISITLIIFLLLKASFGVAQSFNEVVKVVASDRDNSDEYGYSVAISGDYAIVGAFKEDHDVSGGNFLTEAGSAYILEKDGSGNWVEVQKIVASDRAASDQFGYSVSISGDYAIVGAHQDFVSRGSAYIFERDGSGVWSEVEKISASDPQSFDFFGSSVAIGGDYAIVGAHQGNRDAASANSLSNAGSAYVFERDGSGAWSQSQKLDASDRAAEDFFGFSVAMSGTYAIIGAYQEDEDEDELNTLASAGSAYIFLRDGAGSYSEVSKHVASDRGAGDQYGYSVAIYSTRAIIGANKESEDADGLNTASEAGSAYILERDGAGTWAEVQKVVASDREASDEFGYSVAIGFNYAAVGAWKERILAGAAYVFDRNSAGEWAHLQKRVSSDRVNGDQFGVSIALSGLDLMVGANREDQDENGANNRVSAGSAYLFEFENNRPVFTSSSSVSIPENVASGTEVLDVNANNDDGGANDERITYFIAARNEDDLLFDIDSESGEVTIDFLPDFENPIDEDGNNVYFLQINANDGLSSTNQFVFITVTDVDETDPTITSSATASIPENSTVVAYTATADEMVTFTLGSTKDEGFFTVANDNEISFVSSPDFENAQDDDTDNAYVIDVIAEDAAGNTSTLEVTITVTDVDEVDPTITSATTASLVENSTGIVYTATADETVTFTLGSSKDEGLFAIANGNEISFSNSPDFEDPQDGNMDNAYLVDVIAEDVAGNTSTLEVTISVTDIDDTNPVFTSSASASLEENITGIVYSATADETVTFTLGSSKDEASFALANGNEISFSTTPDFEDPQDGNMDNDYLIDIMAEDVAGNTTTLEVTITVTDIDEINPTITSSPTVSIAENSTGVAYTATADETVTFTLGSGKDEGSFALANGNEISFSTTPDFEDPQDGNMDNDYVIDIIAEDAAGNTAMIEVTITVTDVGEFITWDGTDWSNVTGPTASDDVIIDGDYTLNSAATLAVLSLTTNTGNTVIVDSESTLTINGDLINDGDLTIESGSSLITYAANTFTGNDITIKRDTRYSDGKYSFVGSPVEQDASITETTLGDNVYYYDETESYSTNDGLDRWDVMTGEIVPGTGYTQANQKEIMFQGVPNTGTITYSGTYTEDTDDANEGWNLVANPYAAAINVGDFLVENDNITGAVYIWDDNGSDTQRGSNADYIVANAMIATNSTPANMGNRYNQYLGSAQAFFVKLDDNTDTDISFTESMRRADNNSDDHFFRKSESSVVRLNLTNATGLFKQTVIGFLDNATENHLNKIYDAQAFNASSDDGLFTMKAGRSLALNGMTKNWNYVQLQFNVEEAGIYQISVELEGYDSPIYLKDNLTGEVVDLRNTAYSFSSNSGIHTDRFEIVSNPSNLLGLESDDILVYAVNSILHIQSSSSDEREYQLFNMNGKKLLSGSVESNKEINLNAYAKGIYLVFDGQKTHKIILD